VAKRKKRDTALEMPITHSPSFRQIIADWMFIGEEKEDIFSFSVGSTQVAGPINKHRHAPVLEAEIYLHRDGVEFLQNGMSEWLKEHKKVK